MKTQRQGRILEIVRSEAVETQEELVERLRAEGFDVTQATVSRDIKELGLVKVADEAGRYRYRAPEWPGHGYHPERLRRYFRDSVIGFDHSENLVIVKTLPGTAGAVCEAIDLMAWPEIAGTLAGENTILVVVRDRRDVAAMLDRFRQLTG